MTNMIKCDCCGNYYDENELTNYLGMNICPNCELGSIQPYDQTYAGAYCDLGNKETYPIHIGLELEIDGKDAHGHNSLDWNYDREDVARYVDAALKADGYPVWEIKSDCTIQDGFEIALKNPVGFRYFNEILSPRLETVFEKLSSVGMLSDEAKSCGLHVHLTRSELTRDQILSIAVLMDRFWGDFKELSRRRGDFYWCQKPVVSQCPDNDEMYRSFVHDNYRRCVNANQKIRYDGTIYSEKPTLEIRLFRGTLNHKSFVASVHAVMFLYDCAVNKGYMYAKTVSRDQFIADMAAFSPELKDYMVYRNIISDDSTQAVDDNRVVLSRNKLLFTDEYLNSYVSGLH